MVSTISLLVVLLVFQFCLVVELRVGSFAPSTGEVGHKWDSMYRSCVRHHLYCPRLLLHGTGLRSRKSAAAPTTTAPKIRRQA